MAEILTSLDWQGWVTIIVLVLVFIALIREIFSPDITLLIGACILVILGIITPNQFLRGFSREIVFVFAMLFIVVRAIYTNGILSLLATKALPKKGSYRRQLLMLMAPISVASAFLNNTPIVLMVTGVVREWAKIPSKFLMPISQAAIFGGMCTLIGTASNLIVDGLLRQVNTAAGFEFFELALIGLPCLGLGYLYILTIGCKLLPERKEPAESAAHEMREFTSEFLVEEECPLVGRSVKEAFRDEYLIKITRGKLEIDSPSPTERIQAEDHLVFAADVSQFAKLAAIKGLQSLIDKEFELDVRSPHVAEVVVAVGSYLVGRTVKQTMFRSRYGASVVAIYREGRRVPGSVGDVVLFPGDTLLLLSNRPWKLRARNRGDLYPIKDSEQLPVFVPKRAVLVGVVLVGMVAAITAGVPLIYATLVAAGLLLATRCLTIRQAARGIDWHLLLLVAIAFPFGSALVSTGVAELLARGVLTVVGTNPHLLIGGLFLMTLVVTEFVTNTAAALLLFPIALETMLIAGYDSLSAIKATGVTIAIAATSSFLTPIGYQTNTIVYGPGGYRFFDYARVGFGLTLIQLVLGSWLIPIIWPL